MEILKSNEIFGFIKPPIDAHTLGITTISYLLEKCGYKTLLAKKDISEAAIEVKKINNISKVKKWIIDNGITQLGFSYRLDPVDAKELFCNLFFALKGSNLFVENGGPIKRVFYAGLMDSGRLINNELNDTILTFIGGESNIQSLELLGVPMERMPIDLIQDSEYDKMRMTFAYDLISSEKYKYIDYQNHYGYSKCGTDRDSYLDRLKFAAENNSLPLIRAHVGPYYADRKAAIDEFNSWVKQLANDKLLDILSIGTSQLTQSNFGEDWSGLQNGGGVPINSELEYSYIREIAKPMLVRTYAGTKNIVYLSKMYERSLNISWHALSLWWFSELDGRGPNNVLDNLTEHIEVIKYIAQSKKPLEPIVSHHFAFRGCDDVSYIVSAYISSKLAKKCGVNHLILQNMLNTPKSTIGVQDLAKSRVLIKLVRELEDDKFRVSLQTRAGLDYFSPDLEVAKMQLAAVTALMDDIEPDNENSPQIIHVVSYSEATHLATPDIVNDSIRITLGALREYRKLRKSGAIENMKYNKDVTRRSEDLYIETKEAINILEKHIDNLYSAEGFYKVFKEGFFPVPSLIDNNNNYPKAKEYLTIYKDGGIKVVDDELNVLYTPKRYMSIINKMKDINER